MTILTEFTIDEQFLCSVTTHEEGSIYAGRESLTEEELLRVMMGGDRWTMTGSRDHEEFARLRDRLEAEGYIRCERGWWNGDRALREFTLNGVQFNEGDKFGSGGYIRTQLEWKRKYNGTF